MIANSDEYTFGPVPSRRLGRSLGINNIPAKSCTYSCVYCQVGRTTDLTVVRSRFYDPLSIVSSVKSRLAQARALGDRVDYLTFVPDGEPTLDVNLGQEILLLKPLGIPIAVISNSSLLYRDDVIEEIKQADWVSLKLDTVEESTWWKINRPHRGLRLPTMLSGILAFAREFSGKLVTETMLVAGINDSDDGIIELANFIHQLRPARAYLSVPTRPPAERWVRGPNEGVLNRSYQCFSARVKTVELLTHYEGDAFAATGDVEKDLLSITAVHPMRKEAISSLLARAGATWSIVDRLVERGSLVATTYENHVFYLRRFSPAAEELQ